MANARNRLPWLTLRRGNPIPKRHRADHAAKRKDAACLPPLRLPQIPEATFHEFADHARKWSPWSAAYYRQKRAAGYKHNAAVRALAYKWIRVMFHLWKTRSIYNETKYIEQLKKRNSPLVKFIENA